MYDLSPKYFAIENISFSYFIRIVIRCTAFMRYHFAVFRPKHHNVGCSNNLFIGKPIIMRTNVLRLVNHSVSVNFLLLSFCACHFPIIRYDQHK